MDIEEFVAQTLTQINAGIAKVTDAKNMQVNPSVYVSEKSNITAGHMIAANGNDRPVILIKFDLSVVVQSKIEGGGSAKISLLGIGGGKGELASGVDHTRTQRVAFDLPVLFAPAAELS